MEGFVSQSLIMPFEYTVIMPERERTVEASGQHVACVVWHRTATKIPSELFVALRRPGVNITFHDCPIDAFVTTLNAMNEFEAINRQPLVVLVLIEPAELEHKVHVLKQVRTFAPRVLIWLYQASENEHRLRVIRPEELAEWELAEQEWLRMAAEPVVPEVKVTQAFRNASGLRLVADASNGVNDEPAATESSKVPKLLSDDELHMLLDADSARGSGGRIDG
jgi:hypothetical protein